MSVSGEQVSSVEEGDVILEDDGFLRMYMTNAENNIWYQFTISPQGYSWITEPKANPYIPKNNKFVINIKELLIKVREEMNESSSN